MSCSLTDSPVSAAGTGEADAAVADRRTGVEELDVA